MFGGLSVGIDLGGAYVICRAQEEDRKGDKGFWFCRGSVEAEQLCLGCVGEFPCVLHRLVRAVLTILGFLGDALAATNGKGRASQIWIQMGFGRRETAVSPRSTKTIKLAAQLLEELRQASLLPSVLWNSFPCFQNSIACLKNKTCSKEIRLSWTQRLNIMLLLWMIMLLSPEANNIMRSKIINGIKQLKHRYLIRTH